MEQRIAIYTRVSTTDQTTLNQRLRLEKYAELLPPWYGYAYLKIEQTEQSFLGQF